MSAAEIFAALKEENISAEELAAELNIIFEDYFTGTVRLEDTAVTINFLNGQKFRIHVREEQ